jgi:hypothetical protein
MKDLYRRLEIEPTATADEISAAIEKLPEAKARGSILLDSEKRELYDRAHATLKLIARLRFNLDLDMHDSWFIQQYPDFAIMPKPKLTDGATQSALQPEAPAKGVKRRRKRQRNGTNWLLAVLILLIAAGAVILLLNR